MHKHLFSFEPLARLELATYALRNFAEYSAIVWRLVDYLILFFCFLFKILLFPLFRRCGVVSWVNNYTLSISSRTFFLPLL